MAEPSSREPSRPGPVAYASATGRRLSDAVAWLGGHLLRRRAAQLALLLTVAAMGLLGYAFSGPFSGEQRIIISVSAGFAVVGVMGAYLAYRSWDYARRMSLRAADAEANLRAIVRALERHQTKLLASDVATGGLQRTLSEIQLQQSSVVQALGDNNANWLHLSSRVEQSASRLESFNGMQSEIAGIEAKIAHVISNSDDAAAGVQQVATHLKGFAGALDRTNSQLSVLTSRTDKLTGDVEDVSSCTASLGADLDQIRLAVAGLENAARAAEQSVDAYRDGNAAAAAAWTARLAGHERDMRALAGTVAKVETELAATRQAQSAASHVQELARKVGSLQLAVHDFQKGHRRRVEQVELATASLESLTLSSSERILQELEILKRSTGEARATTASLVAGVEQRATLLESTLSFANEQRQTQARQISELEDSLARITSNQSAAADDFMSQLSSLRQFAGEESGRIAELAATLAALRSQVQALEPISIDGAKAIDEIKARIAEMPDRISEVGREAAEISAAIGAEHIASLAKHLTQVETSLSAADARGAAAVAQVKGELSALADRTGAISATFEAATEDLRKRQKETVATASRAAERLDKVERSVDARASEIDVVKQALAEVSRTQSARVDDIHSEIGALAALATTLKPMVEASTAGLQTRLQELAVSASHASGRLDKVETSLLGSNASAEARLKELSEGIASIRDVAASCLGRVEVLESSLSATDARGDAAIAQVKSEISTFADRTSAIAASFEAAAADLRKRQDETAASASRASERLDKVERSVDAGAGEVDVVKRAVAEMTRTQSASIEASRKTNELLHEQFKSIREAMTGEFGRVGVLAAGLEALQSSVDQSGSLTLADMQDVRTNLGALSARMADVILEIDAQLADVSQRLSETTDVAVQADRQIVLDSASWFEPGNRKLRAEHVASVESEWTRRLSIDISRPAIGYMATRINQLERELDGRLRASIEDTLLRTLVARSVKGPSISVLELGASFGIESAVMYDQLRDHFSKLTFTIIDPLDAFANDTRLDPQTGLPVSEHILRRNLARAGAPEGCSALIKRPSADVQALEEASASTYDVLVIDADHSYAGVKVDFENYARLVKLGGYIVFAGYGDPDEPDVTAFVDEEVADSPHVALVGASWRTAVYRVVRADGGRRKAPVARAKPAPRKRRQARSA